METLHIYIIEISFITILDVTTCQQSIAKPPMEDSYGRLHMNIDVREIKQVVNILHIHLKNISGVFLEGCRDPIEGPSPVDTLAHTRARD